MRNFVLLPFQASIISLLKFANAQSTPYNPYNLLTVPGCSTAYTIVTSCELKLGAAATNTASEFSCICYDNSGNYVPSSYDDAASSCSSYEVTAFSTQGNAFLAYIAGFCTNTLYAPTGTAAVTTSSDTRIGGNTPIPATPSPTSTLSTNLSGSSNSASSSKTASSTPAPSTAGGTAGGAVTTTSSKAAGSRVGYIYREGTIWSILSPFLAAFLAF